MEPLLRNDKSGPSVRLLHLIAHTDTNAQPVPITVGEWSPAEPTQIRSDGPKHVAECLLSNPSRCLTLS
jgi:hypothetical protein